ncbi:MAG: SHOCT domain-containing protein [Coriobacteriia bacterium]|nr:SHOCT domain-containing protein [Coriobacteriia bacterium]
MGFIQAFAGAIGGAFAEQWKDFYTVPTGLSGTAGLSPAVKSGTNAGRGSNVKGSENIITNGSQILVPEGFAVVTIENGAITGFCAEPGGYTWSSDAVYSQSFLSGGGLIESVVKNSWERFKFGGMPGAQQLAFYVNLKEIPNNRFGTQAEIYWFDPYFNNAQVGAITRGTYTLKILDPILFIKGFVPARYYSQNAIPFDFQDMDNDAASQLFNEVVGSLSAAFSNYLNDPDAQHTMARIQGDSVGFAQSLAGAVEAGYYWTSGRGLSIVTAALLAIEYDEASKALLAEVRAADALSGARGNSFLQQSVARGIQAAGENPSGGAIGLGMMGMGIGASTAVAGGLQQPNTPPAAFDPMTGQPLGQPAPAPAPLFDPMTGQPLAQPAPAPAPAPAATDPYEELAKLKGLLDGGIISQADFDAKKNQLLGL